MESKPTVGVIGVGVMGAAVVQRLLSTGFPVCVRDIRAESEQQARAAGASVCESPAALARKCAVVISLVVDAAQTEEVVFGPQGAAETLSKDAVLIMSSTVQPAAAESLGARLAARGLSMLDAPVSGGPAKARSGQMSMMIGGTDASYDRARPVLEAISGTRVRIGNRPGDGSKAKIVNNMLAGVNLAAACEAMAFGIKLGLDPIAIVDVVSASSGGSWIFADRMPRVLSNDYTPRAALDILKKDLTIIKQVAQELGFPAPMTSAGQQVFVDASAMGLGSQDDAAVVKLYQALTGIVLPTSR
jgi:3-hydroxyisobutyrate dehydrogenase